ncbi:MAG: hypothetical protein K0S36_2521 [Nitrosospira multiformis]|jgi:hypothetical protein|nr:hypothetical protein [Nitrosospira multiformis]
MQGYAACNFNIAEIKKKKPGISRAVDTAIAFLLFYFSILGEISE